MHLVSKLPCSMLYVCLTNWAVHSDTTHEETGQHQVHSQLSSDDYGLGKNFSEVPQYLMMYITPEIQAQQAHFHCEYLYTSMNISAINRLA